MTQLFLNPLTKFTSDNITSLPGARLYFYQNNSSTPKAVYADKNKVTSLGVYVEADSAGIFEPIWLDGTYRATLKYSTNWTSDPVGVVQTGWPIDDVGDIGNFAAFAAWDSTFTYDITTNTFVTGPDGLYYKSIQNPNLNKNPVSNPDYWEQVFIVGVWNAYKTYAANDIVVRSGKLYASIAEGNLNHQPPNAVYWSDLTSINTIFVAKKSAGGQSVISSTALVDVTGMTITLANGVYYHVRGHITYTCGLTTANGIAVDFTGASTVSYLWTSNTNATSANAAPTANSAIGSIIFTKFPNSAAGNEEVITFDAIVLGTGNPYKLRFAQKVSDATATTINWAVMTATSII